VLNFKPMLCAGQHPCGEKNQALAFWSLVCCDAVASQYSSGGGGQMLESISYDHKSLSLGAGFRHLLNAVSFISVILHSCSWLRLVTKTVRVGVQCERGPLSFLLLCSLLLI
jgi:hypothetical protein